MAYFHTTVLDEQIKALPTVSTASGSVATFDTDMTENLVEVKCQILAKQEGSGTPSPSNPRPITTYSEMNVSACGINLCDEVFEVGGIATGSGQNDDTMTQYIRTKNYISVLPDMSLYFYVSANTSIQFRIFYYDREKNYLSYVNWTTTRTQTTPSNAYFMRLLPYLQYGTTYNNDISINYPSTDTQYHAYNGTTANIPFGQTVAQGLLNVGTGKLEIEMLEVDMGNLTWTLAGSGRLNTSIAGVKLYGNTQTSQAKCSWYQVVNGNTVANVDKSLCVSFNNSNVCQVNDSDYNGGNPNDFKTAVTGQKIIYELATPIEIQLDSIALQALLNENNVWCDTGDTEVKYLLTVGKAIS